MTDGEALAVVTTPATATKTTPQPNRGTYGFMPADWGYALVGSGEEVNSAGEQPCVLVICLRR